MVNTRNEAARGMKGSEETKRKRRRPTGAGGKAGKKKQGGELRGGVCGEEIDE